MDVVKNDPILNVFIGGSGYFFEFFPFFDARFSGICIWCNEDFLSRFMKLKNRLFSSRPKMSKNGFEVATNQKKV